MADGCRARSVQPDFVVPSFYRIFREATDAGAPTARRARRAQLRRQPTAGGTTTTAVVPGDSWHLRTSGVAGFDNGTVNDLNLPVVEIGLRRVAVWGSDVIHARVAVLAAWQLGAMRARGRSNGAPAARIAGSVARDGTIVFTVRDASIADWDVCCVEAAAELPWIAVPALDAVLRREAA